MILNYPLSIVVVDDNENLLEVIEMHLEDKNIFKIKLFTSPKKALEYIQNSPCHIVIIDINMKEMYGDELLDKINKLNKGIRSIIITGEDKLINFHSCFRKKADDFILKPFSQEDLINSINDCHLQLKKWKIMFDKIAENKAKTKQLA